MPFKSEAQRRFLYATNPKVAKKFSKHTPAGTKLPDRVKKAEALSTLMIASMRDEMSEIAGKHKTAASKKKNVSRKTALYNMLYGEVPKRKGSLVTNLTKVMAALPGNPLPYTLTDAARVADIKRHHAALKAHYAKRSRTNAKLLLGGAATIGLGALAAKRLKNKRKTKKAGARLAKTAFAQATKTIDTKPIDVNVSAKQMKVTKNAGAPRGFRGPRVPTIAKGKRADPLNPSQVTNA